MTTIRAMQWWDIAAVAAIDAEVFGATAWPAETFWSELAADGREYVVAGDPPIAYAGLWLNPPDADLQTIAVAPAAQGGGLGAALLEHVVGHARAASCRRMHLEVKAGNPAQRLYEQFGFQVVRVRPRYYPDFTDAVVMGLDL
jgi:ribosomal-protein-alanine N-acetyltransferase